MSLKFPISLVGKKGGSDNILDSIPAEGAWSLRELSSNYIDQSIVNIRRSNDNESSDFTATQIRNGTLETWVGVGNDGFVTKLYDQTGGGSDLLTFTSSQQPKIVSNGFLLTENGQPYMQFGLDDIRMYTSSNNWLAGTSFSVFAVATQTYRDPLYAQNLWSNNLPQNGNGKFRALFTQSPNYKMNFWSSNTGNIVAGSYSQSLITCIANGMLAGENHNVKIWSNESFGEWNGTGKLTPSNGRFCVGDIVGSSPSSSNGEWYGKIQEIMVFSSDKTADRQVISDSINSYYLLY